MVAAERLIRLAGETDLAGFRRAARTLLAEGVPPERVAWTVGGEGTLDWSAAAVPEAVGPGADVPDAGPAGAARHAHAEPQAQDTLGAPVRIPEAGEEHHATGPADAGASPPPSTSPNDHETRHPIGPGDRPADAAPEIRVPAAFVALCGSVVLHRDPQRFGLLYRLLWRLVHEPALRHDPLDPDVLRAQSLARAVERDRHKMRAFVRFRPIARGAGEPPLHVAWFEPAHHIVEAEAPFFARRFAALHWALLTPERSARWDGQRLHLGPGARRDEAPPADAGEALWLTYYEHIFNPARLKLDAMRKEMPRRYWPLLPEARLIEPLAAQAAQRSAAMLARGASVPARKLPKSAATRVPARGPRAPAPGERPSAEGVPTEAAEGWRTLDELRAATERCRECPIGEHATQSVFGEGPLHAPLMLVGEQPGDQEDLSGRPFVGPAGRLLDRALSELGWDRSRLYVTNAVKHFKFELRGTRRIHKTPSQREAAACLHWLESEIERVQPRAMVALGATAARSLLGRQVGITAERGRWLVREDGREVLVTLHPSALLRVDPAEREAAYRAWVADLARASERAGGG